MSKAEELAEKIYPNGDTYIFGDASIACQVAYVKGYHQAEKDLELTWEDISIIRQIIFDYNRQVRNEMSIPNDIEYCKEILKRFKEKK